MRTHEAELEDAADRMLQPLRRGKPISQCSQIGTLLLRKEGVLTIRRPAITLCTLALPALLSATGILGASLSEVKSYPEQNYAPANLSDAAASLGPQTLLPLLIKTRLRTGPFIAPRDEKPPAAVPPLDLYLTYAHAVSLQFQQDGLPPFDGTCLGVAPNTNATLKLVRDVLADRPISNLITTISKHPKLLSKIDAAIRDALRKAGIDKALTLESLKYPDVRLCPFTDEQALETEAKKKGGIWAAVVVDAPSSTDAYDWRYSLRFNFTAVPSSHTLYDRFASGISKKFFGYYSSGFLSLQAAINKQILKLSTPDSGDDSVRLLPTPTSEPALLGLFANTIGRIEGISDGIFDDLRRLDNQPPIPDAADVQMDEATENRLMDQVLPYGMPFPLAPYKHNTFFDFAGNLIGLIVIFSFLIPLSVMLRALVLEKETKLRESLLMMGATLPAYYSSLLVNFGITFTVIALITAAEFGSSCFTHSSPELVVILFVLFALSALTFTLALSPFFRNAKVAALVGPLIFFVTSQLYNLFLDRGVLVEGAAGTKALSSLLPAMAFYLGASQMSKYEGSQQGITWATIHEGDFPFSATLFFLALDTVLYAFLAWYLDQVVPSEYGLQRRPWFLCLPSYWCPNRGDDASVMPLRAPLHPHAFQPLQEEADRDTEAGARGRPLAAEQLPPLPEGAGSVRTFGLRKVFSNNVAVHGLDLEMRSGQISALLGANGAGKTTVISMLTGLIPPSAGDATIDGLSILTDMRAIRNSIGVCPQANVIFESLTPRQHLRLFASLKGLGGAEQTEAVDQILQEVGLGLRADTRAAQLSGGQKRKLCLGIALIGSSRTLFLDEPSSGMDPHSRRAIWQLLKSQREGRTIVLTTHFLDEAELLADRIAIMAEGSLRCVGSPLFLKSNFGVGYRLTLTKQPAYDEEAVLTIARRHVPSAAVIADARFEAEIGLPGQDLRAFQRLLVDLERELPSLGVGDFGMSCTTLEDVFLRINETALERLALRTKQLRSSASQGAAPSAADAATAAVSGESKLAAAPPAPLFAPTTAPAQEVPASAPMPNSAFNGDFSAASKPKADASTATQMRLQLSLFLGLVNKRRLTAQRSLCTTCCQLLFPVVLVFFALLLLSANITFIGPPLELTPASVFAPSVHRPVQILVSDSNASSFLQPPLTAQGWSPQPLAHTSNLFPQAAGQVSDFLIASPSADRPAAIAIASAALNASALPIPLPLPKVLPIPIATLGFNASSVHALPAMVNSLYDALLRRATDGGSTLSAVAKELPQTERETATIDAFVSVFASIMILIPFAFVAASFVTPLVAELESGSKQLQFVAGVTSYTYWAASWTWDALMYIAVLACTMAVFLMMNRDEFTGSYESTLGTFLTLAAFGVATLPLSSAVSFGFTSPSTALICMIAFHFISGFGLIITNFILTSIESTSEVNKSLQLLYMFFPAYNLGKAFFFLSTRQALHTLGAPKLPLYDFSNLIKGNTLAGPIFFMLVEGAVFALLTLALQQFEALAAFFSGCIPSLGALRSEGPGGGASVRTSYANALLEDASVQAEREAVDSAGDVATSPLVLRHLRKQFGGPGGKLAVRDLCLRVGNGECFGFLGVNGAGKSTTFSMLTGAITPTAGDALLHGMSTRTSQNQIRKLIGYCPQQDALQSLMTGREMLRLYARIKQVPLRDIELEVDSLIQDLDLVKFADKPCGTYSGGNKRKLCVGIALIGDPSLVLLDEPSSGMDAASKRFLWSVIKRRTASCCTVLTTHSMEECEALCARICVMVDGALRCLGPIQTLKSRYGQGFKLELRLDLQRAKPEQVLEFLQARTDAVLEELEAPMMVLNVPRGGVATLPELFGELAEARDRFGVSECSVTQCTLEQIFILFASRNEMRSSTAA